MSSQSYDIIGDIHGCANTLRQLLHKLGYVCRNGVYCHPRSKVIFLGDFVDRGDNQLECLEMVRSMIDNNQALTVMGNHEFNAIAYYTTDPEGGYLRPHTDAKRRQHAKFLDAVEHDPELWAYWVDWFKTLPLWLDLGDLRVVHACWDWDAINALASYPDQGRYVSDRLLVDYGHSNAPAYEAVETLLKGKELELPRGQSFRDKDGIKRHSIRVRWWDQDAENFRDAYMGPDEARTHIPDDEIDGDHLVEYGHHEPPVFLGHYWLKGRPTALAKNIACLDYSVARPGGQLVAYRWQGEAVIDDSRFVAVDREDSD